MSLVLPFPWRGIWRRVSRTLARGGRGPSPEPVVVYTAANTLEAQVVAGRLEAEGIPSWLRSEALGNAYGLTVGPLAQVDILVPAALADQARLALQDPDDPTDA